MQFLYTKYVEILMNLFKLDPVATQLSAMWHAVWHALEFGIDSRPHISLTPLLFV